MRYLYTWSHDVRQGWNPDHIWQCVTNHESLDLSFVAPSCFSNIHSPSFLSSSPCTYFWGMCLPPSLILDMTIWLVLSGKLFIGRVPTEPASVLLFAMGRRCHVQSSVLRWRRCAGTIASRLYQINTDLWRQRNGYSFKLLSLGVVSDVQHSWSCG